MLQKISKQEKILKKNGGFGIEILFPGKGAGSEDSGIGTIGRIDQATVTPDQQGESMAVEKEDIRLTAVEDCNVVLFVTDRNARVFKEGMYIGNINRPK